MASRVSDELQATGKALRDEVDAVARRGAAIRDETAEVLEDWQLSHWREGRISAIWPGSSGCRRLPCDNG